MALNEQLQTVLTRCGDLMENSEDRRGQQEMIQIVADAVSEKRHAVIQAGTGTGKSLAYLIGTLVPGKPTVVATATKTLQDQLANSELPMMEQALGRPMMWSVLKGRSNYLCLQRLDEALERTAQLQFDTGEADNLRAAGTTDNHTASKGDLAEFETFAAESTTGDRAELVTEPPAYLWSQVSVGLNECPGASNCPRGDDCFAEAAKRRAAGSDITIVNTHLYGLHLKNRGSVLPPHDVVVFDEAHAIEDILSSTIGSELNARSLTTVARLAAGILAQVEQPAKLEDTAARFEHSLVGQHGSRLKQGVIGQSRDQLVRARELVAELAQMVRAIGDTSSADVATRKSRMQTASGALLIAIDGFLDPPDDHAMWIGGPDDSPVLLMAPVDVSNSLESLLWSPQDADEVVIVDDEPIARADMFPNTAIFTSATIPDRLVERLGIPSENVSVDDVGSPFEFETNTLLYCAAHLPEPRSNAYHSQSVGEIERLINVAGGRTLALFTSYRAMHDAADTLQETLSTPVTRQGDMPRHQLVEEFTNNPELSLFATMSFWTGIDVPGDTLSLVIIDKIPFPRRTDPLLEARRERFGAQGFVEVDLPRAATNLAQGAGRLVRSATDRGVVAVLDSRLANNSRYRWQLIEALPKMPRTKEFADVEAFFNNDAD